MSILVEIKKGSRVKEKSSGRTGELIDFKLTPNGVADPGIVAVFFIKLDNGRLLSATSENFETIEGEKYDEFYPSVHFNRLIEKKNSF